MKRSGRSTKQRRERGGLDWVKKRQIPVISVLIADPDKRSRAS